MKHNIKFLIPIAMVTLSSCGSANNKVSLVFGGIGYKLMYNNKAINVANYLPDKEYNFKIEINPDYSTYVEMPSKIIITTPDGRGYSDYTYNPTTGDLVISLKEDINISALTTYKENLPTLDECSWTEIDRISKLGIADKVFKVGDTKVLKDYKEFDGTNEHYEDIQIRIMGFNHDDLADGKGKAGISLEFANIPTYGPNVWYPRDAGVVEHNNLDFSQTTLNTCFLNSMEEHSFLFSIPEELRNVIKEVNKYISVGENYELATYKTKGFILSASECANDNLVTSSEYRYEGDIYEIYSGGDQANKRAKLTPTGRGGIDGYGWLTRSPRKWGVSSSSEYGIYKGVWASGVSAPNPTYLDRWDIGLPGMVTLNGASCGVVCFCI